MKRINSISCRLLLNILIWETAWSTHTHSNLTCISLFRITAADINIGLSLYWIDYADKSLLASYPNIRDYLGRLKARPAFQTGVIRPDEDQAAILKDLNYKAYIKV